MKKLWEKNWKLNKVIEHFETRDDLLFDQKLLPFDIYGSFAQAMMLHKIGLFTIEELQNVKRGLLEVLELDKQGKFKLEEGDEDIHSKIELYLTEHYGDVGKKIHTGRSRNDQVLTAERLFAKDSLLTSWENTLSLIESLLQFAKKYEFVPLPGYTHMQKAMPASVGMWAGAYAQNLLDDLILLKAAYDYVDHSPLGSAAGFGVPLNLDREYTAKLLGFARVQNITLSVQHSRGKTYGEILAALSAVLLDLSRLAADVLLFTTTEFNYFTVADELCTGSSIMPQKKNVDVAELLRAKIHALLGNFTQIMGVESSLISGYNRDTQDTKKPFIEGMETARLSIQVADILINNITPNEDVLKKAFTSEIFATHKALEMVVSGVPFRQAYQKVGRDDPRYKVAGVVEELKKSTHIGGTGNLGLVKLDKRHMDEKDFFEKVSNLFHNSLQNLIQ